MSNEVFNFGPHRMRTRQQETPVVQLGRGFTSGIKPFRKPPRIFILTFDQGAMRICYNSNGTVNASDLSPRNLLRLEAFADFHGMHESFLYNHPVYGERRVRFERAYESPDVQHGSAEEFSIDLIEVPS